VGREMAPGAPPPPSAHPSRRARVKTVAPVQADCRRAKPFCRFMLNVARGTRSLARGGVLCRPGQTGERAVWGVSDPPPETHRRPQPRPRGSLTPHVSQHVSQRFCRRRSTHLCSEITDAITMAAARACDVRSGRRSRTPRRRLLQRVPGRIAPTLSHGLRTATSTGFGIGSRGANLLAITCDSMALCPAPYKALRFAPPRVPRAFGP
jgi:hypothetical protein